MSVKLSTTRGRSGTEGEQRFQVLFDRHHLEVFRYCARRLDRPDAEDATAEVFATAWRRIDTIPEGDRARLWLIGVAYKVVGNQYRSRRRRGRLQEKLTSTYQGSSWQANDFIDEQDVLKALGAMGASDREILRLCAWDGLTNPEIAVVLEISENAVAQRLHRARSRLKKAFEVQRQLGGEELQS